MNHTLQNFFKSIGKLKYIFGGCSLFTVFRYTGWAHTGEQKNQTQGSGFAAGQKW